jgi:hypothetical protein
MSSSFVYPLVLLDPPLAWQESSSSNNGSSSISAGLFGCQLGSHIGSRCLPIIDHGLHGGAAIQEGMVHMSSGRDASMLNLWTQSWKQKRFIPGRRANQAVSASLQTGYMAWGQRPTTSVLWDSFARPPMRHLSGCCVQYLDLSTLWEGLADLR